MLHVLCTCLAFFLFQIMFTDITQGPLMPVKMKLPMDKAVSSVLKKKFNLSNVCSCSTVLYYSETCF